MRPCLRLIAGAARTLECVCAGDAHAAPAPETVLALLALSRASVDSDAGDSDEDKFRAPPPNITDGPKREKGTPYKFIYRLG